MKGTDDHAKMTARRNTSVLGAVALVFLMLGVSGCELRRDIFIEVIQEGPIRTDPANRVERIYSYYLDQNGKKVKHGEEYEWRWEARVLHVTTFRHGRKMLGYVEHYTH